MWMGGQMGRCRGQMGRCRMKKCYKGCTCKCVRKDSSHDKGCVGGGRRRHKVKMCV